MALIAHDRRRNIGGISHAYHAKYLGEYINEAWCDDSFAQWEELRGADGRHGFGPFGTAHAFVLDTKHATPVVIVIDRWPIVIDAGELGEVDGSGSCNVVRMPYGA